MSRQSEGSHHDGSEAVDQPLDRQNTQIHNGLLDTGKPGIEPRNFVFLTKKNA